MKKSQPVPSLAERERPGLSATLTGPVRPDACQSCFAPHPDIYREYDAYDKPTVILVALCRECGDRLVEPHARIYAQLTPNGPFPGAMVICVDCRHREGLRCCSADAKANGGNGVMLTITKPSRMHVCRSPRSTSGFVDLWSVPPSACQSKVVA